MYIKILNMKWNASYQLTYIYMSSSKYNSIRLNLIKIVSVVKKGTLSLSHSVYEQIIYELEK